MEELRLAKSDYVYICMQAYNIYNHTVLYSPELSACVVCILSRIYTTQTSSCSGLCRQVFNLSMYIVCPDGTR